MEPQKIKMNGSISPGGNYFWAGALTLAWKELRDQIVKQQIELETQDESIREIVTNLNVSSFSKNDLSPQSYYTCAGHGNQTIQKINKEVKNKFPHKTTKAIIANLEDNHFIAFAYFFKQIEFQWAFKKMKVMFKNKRVNGFTAEKDHQRKIVLVRDYENQNNFLFRIQAKQQNEQIFILKKQEKIKAEQVVEIVEKSKKENEIPLKKGDIFKMPCISIKYKRSVEELLGKSFKNPSMEGYSISQIYEIINVEINENGIKVQNEGLLKGKSAMQVLKFQRKIILDGSFWILMREREKNAYLVSYINTLEQEIG